MLSFFFCGVENVDSQEDGDPKLLETVRRSIVEKSITSSGKVRETAGKHAHAEHNNVKTAAESTNYDSLFVGE